MKAGTAKCPRCGKTLWIRKDGCLPKHKDRPGGTTYSSWPGAEPCSFGGRSVEVNVDEMTERPDETEGAP